MSSVTSVPGPRSDELTVTSRTLRWPLWAAVIFALLYLAAAFVVPAPPAVTATGDQVVRYYHQHQDAVRLSTWLLAVSGIPFFLFVCWLRTRLRGIAADLALIGGLTVGISTMVWSWFGAGLALSSTNVPADVARSLLDIADFYGPVLTVGVILLVVPVALLPRGTGSSFPTWVRALSLLLVVEQAVESFTIFPTSGFFSPGDSMNFLVGAPLFLIWVVATAVGGTGKVPAEAD
jgi:hypothetical protein